MHGESSKIIAKGVDSLFVFMDCRDILAWENIYQKVEAARHDDELKINGVDLIKVKAWIKAFPQCVKADQFMIFMNRVGCYIRLLSLGFELNGFENLVFKLCRLLDKLTGRSEAWADRLKVSRIDVFCDFAYNGDFDFERFRTKLKKCGIFKDAKSADGITYYFGSRDIMLCRLYVKSAEIKNSGKDYLKVAWTENGCQNEKIWRLEFEVHKNKLEELAKYRNLSCFDKDMTQQIFKHGVEALEYVKASRADVPLKDRKLEPIWRMLQQEFDIEYSIDRAAVRQANIEYRFKMAKKYVISWLIARGIKFDRIDQNLKREFSINQFDYENAIKQQKTKVNFLE